jgi:hypothetical protein
MTRDERRKLHISINSLGNYTLGTIVRQHFPEASPQDINKIAKRVIQEAHNIISPKTSEQNKKIKNVQSE